MSNKTQLQTNNTKLDELTSLAATMKDKAAALPDAGGGSVETCTFKCINNSGYTDLASFAVSVLLEDGTIDAIEVSDDVYASNVVCGSAIGVVKNNAPYVNASITYDGAIVSAAGIYTLKAPTVSGEVATVIIE